MLLAGRRISASFQGWVSRVEGKLWAPTVSETRPVSGEKPEGGFLKEMPHGPAYPTPRAKALVTSRIPRHPAYLGVFLPHPMGTLRKEVRTWYRTHPTQKPRAAGASSAGFARLWQEGWERRG